MRSRLQGLLLDRKILFFVLIMVSISIFTLTVAYAALNTVLNITGNAEVVASSWDIHLDNINVRSGSVGGVAPKITNATTATFSTKLTTPGDFYEFSIDVVNDGTIDAMIDSVTKTPTLNEAQAKYLNYIVEYENGNTISTKQLVKAESFVRLRVRVEYRKDLVASDLPTTNDSLTLSFTVNYVQSDNSGSSVKDDGLYVDVEYPVGKEVCIKDECFYVISSTYDTVTMLAKYNLHVGNECTSVTSCVLYGDNETGIQDSTMIGWTSGSTYPRKGTIQFSSNAYWDSTVSSGTYVYNSNSTLYNYMEKYKTYLESLGSFVKSVRPLSIDELEVFDCSNNDLYQCFNLPEWFYTTSYWTGMIDSDSLLWGIDSDGTFGRNSYSKYNDYGVRPVVTIFKNENVNSGKLVANGSLDEVGTVVTIGNESFYTIGTEGDNVKLLAKYNLLVGNKYDDINKAVPLENPTGIQNENAKGYIKYYSADAPIIGTIHFSSTNYWLSTVSSYPAYVYNKNTNFYEYVEKYKDYLEGLGANVNEARLITMDELEGLGCKRTSYSCSEAPSWLYTSTYWSGMANGTHNVWFVDSDSDLDSGSHNDAHHFGIRPVIIIPKSQF